MSQVKHLLESKGSTVFSIAPEAPVLEAIKHMAEHRIGRAAGDARRGAGRASCPNAITRAR